LQSLAFTVAVRMIWIDLLRERWRPAMSLSIKLENISFSMGETTIKAYRGYPPQSSNWCHGIHDTYYVCHFVSYI
jgi:hypothetical protein